MKYMAFIVKNGQDRMVRNLITGEEVFQSKDPKRYEELHSKWKRNKRARDKEQVMKLLGLTKVRGAMSGKVYWE
ncbi:MAG: hypothetical protein HGA77_04845 [Chlorobiaceae bacterium]|nr:hypothetical protein [Chlorobiaceae bacterium]